ncbi:hypothetical protein Bbelb_216290 [Branchiostoma belcheri]|nr:hypothetical protein Bbelb_216290 [Branchiostoma belcheri]
MSTDGTQTGHKNGGMSGLEPGTSRFRVEHFAATPHDQEPIAQARPPNALYARFIANLRKLNGGRSRNSQRQAAAARGDMAAARRGWSELTEQQPETGDEAETPEGWPNLMELLEPEKWNNY